MPEPTLITELKSFMKAAHAVVEAEACHYLSLEKIEFDHIHPAFASGLASASQSV